MRHSSGNSSEKRPCDTVPKIGGENSENDKARLLLEKTHLPVNLHSTTNPAVNEPLKARSQQAAEFGRKLLRERLGGDGFQQPIDSGCVLIRNIAACDRGVQPLISDAGVAYGC